MSRFVTTASAIGLLVGFATAASAQTAPTYPAPAYPAPASAQQPGLLGLTGAVPATTPGPYVRLNSGYSFSEQSNDSWLIGGGLGYRFSPNIRADLTFDYRPDFDQDTNFGIGPGPKTGLSNWTAMANGYYDFNLPMLNPLVPYIGGGIGVAQNSYDGVTVTTNSTSTSRFTGSEKNQFAWQAMAGLSYYFTPTVALDVGYRYLDAGNSGFGTHLQTNEVTAAIRYGF